MVKLTNGVTRAVRVSEPGVASTFRTVPIGTPGTYGLPPCEPNVTMRWPGLSGALESSTWNRSRPAAAPRPVPCTTPICWEPSSRPPTDDDASVTSRTVAVDGPDAVTRPTRPSPVTTVWPGFTPSALPASRVTVSSYPCRPRIAMTCAATTR